ncbi:hypothetical protein SO802_011705 [Lithocarpus litseifolius]|uniref:DDE Tnp4 domain-containing protein n=1 Tax=Lithocarpus litseifolius TaxID=425828 RepID=A0AAW2D243_9ROSI
MDLNDEVLKTIIFSDFMRKLALVHAACRYLCYIIHQRQQLKRRRVSHIPTQSTTERQKVRDELMSRLRNSKKCYDVICMGPQAFQGLCDILRRDGDLQDTQRATVEEQVGKFLHMLAHNQMTRTMSFFCRSGKTISRHFHNVLRSIIMLEDQFLQQPDVTQVPLEILQSNRFNPYFKDCIGVLDGTHVHVKVSNEDAPRYRGRKGYTTQNVLAACSFDLKFTYVLPGWEGTASDSKIIKSALTRNNNLKIPQGKYYLVDAGYMNRSV